ncbi:MAG TPA: DMT family transporter [Candidatus Limnocylindrales bacterium]|nr:DMT family transporter [Candidatus Limnocylindrales bacterium]
MKRAGRGELYAALAAIGYGSAYVATAFALRSFEPLPIAVYRTLLGAIALTLVIAAMRSNGRTAAAHASVAAARPSRMVRAVHLAVIAACGGPIFLAGMNFAIAGVGATIASFVAGLYTVLAAVFAPFLLREPLRPRPLVGFVAALVGTAFLAELDLGGEGIAGIGWGLMAAVSFALFLVLSRKWARADGFDALIVSLANMTATTLVLGVVVVVTNPASLLPRAIVPEALVAIAWLAVVVAGGQALAVASTKLVPAARTAAFLLLNPVTATILAFALLGERVEPIQVLGGGLVLAGIAAATIERSPPQGR